MNNDQKIEQEKRKMLTDYQKLAMMTESFPGNKTFDRFVEHSNTWKEKIESLFNHLSEADFDNLKRTIFYGQSGMQIHPDGEQELRFIHGMLGLITELYELIQLTLEEQTIDPIHLKEELDDLCWYIALLCNSHNIDFVSMLKTNIDKLATRYPDKFSVENALYRNLMAERIVLEGNPEGQREGNAERQVEDIGAMKGMKMRHDEPGKLIPRTSEGL